MSRIQSEEWREKERLAHAVATVRRQKERREKIRIALKPLHLPDYQKMVAWRNHINEAN